MRTLAALILGASLAAACTGGPAPSPADPAIGTTPAVAAPAAAVALKDIPRTSGSPVAPAASVPAIGKGDLTDIAGRSYLRVLVTPEQVHFETRDGQHRGRTVDAVGAFAAILNNALPRPVQVAYIATSEDALVSDLLAGKGDIAVNLRLTFERDDQVAFAPPVRTGIREWIVTGPSVPALVSLEDVGGRTIHVRRGSDHHASLIRLNTQLKTINRAPATIALGSASQTDEDLLQLVNAGTLPATIVDDYVLEACCAALSGLKVNRDVAVSQDGIIAWATRKDAVALSAAVRDFFSTHRLSWP